MTSNHDQSDADLSSEQRQLIEALSMTDIQSIDERLLANTCDHWRKVAMVVGLAIMELPGRIKGIPDIYLSQRIRKLVKDGLLESQGKSDSMHFDEVRRPA